MAVATSSMDSCTERKEEKTRALFLHWEGVPLSVPLGVGDRPTRGRGPHQGLFISVYQPPRNSSRLFGSERILTSLLWSDIHAVGRSSSTFAVRLLFLHLWVIVRSKGTWKRTLEC